jgi:hypothetical protein
VPIHPYIEDLFRQFVDRKKRQGDTRLFPELPYMNESCGHKASKWFGEFKKKYGIDSKEVVVQVTLQVKTRLKTIKKTQDKPMPPKPGFLATMTSLRFLPQ